MSRHDAGGERGQAALPLPDDARLIPDVSIRLGDEGKNLAREALQQLRTRYLHLER